MPRVSVVLCSYNQRQYLHDAVQSVLDQTFGDWELIAIDNGSTDGSLALLRSYQDPRIKVLSDGTNKAIGKRFNEGIAAASGEFISFLYSDDMYLPDKLEVQVAEFDRRPSDFGLVYGWALGLNQNTGARFRYRTFRGSGTVLTDYLDHVGILAIDMLSPMTRREAFLRYPFYEDIFAEGEIAYAKVAMRYRFAFCDRPFVILRDHGANRGRAIKKNFEMMVVALERLGQHADFPESAHASLERVLPRLARRLAWQLARLDGGAEEIRASVRASIKLTWRSLLDPKVYGALALAALPVDSRRKVNAIGHRLRSAPRNLGLIEGYGGGS